MVKILLSPLPCIFLPFVAVCMCCAMMISCLVQAVQPRQPAPAVELSRPGEVSAETLVSLQNTVLPANDPLELAQRLRGQGPIDPTVATAAAPFELGDRQVFWITDQDSSENTRVEAELEALEKRAASET